MIHGNPIGGEFSTNKFVHKDLILKKFVSGSWTVSGRYALELIFKNNKSLCKKTIYLPIYNCPSTHYVIKKYFKKIIFYELDSNFKPKKKKFKKNSVLIFVNYFGHNCKFVFRKDLTIIEDLTHLMLDTIKIQKNRFYFASLRKFGVFNFGGWTNIINQKVNKNSINFLESYRKKNFYYLSLKKKNLEIEHKLLNLLSREEKKIFRKKICISQKSIKCLTDISEKKIKLARKTNYLYLQKNIEIEYLKIPFRKSETPIFFFLKFFNIDERNRVRKILNNNNIYCPILWPLNSYDLSNFSHSKSLSENTLAIPIDHRFSIRDMKYILKVLKKI
jgi:hypothetical protein